MRKPDPSRVLADLASTLDVEETLRRFPRLDRFQLSAWLQEAAARAGESGSASPEPRGGSRAGVLRVDGAARGNPGPAGIGVVLERPGAPPLGRGEFIGEATNNGAEYRALLAGMALAQEQGVRELTVFSDSELMVRQMTGAYRVKHPELRRLFAQAQEAAARFASVAFRHVAREENVEADRLANMAIDASSPVTL